jgi:hypothetical protein
MFAQHPGSLVAGVSIAVAAILMSISPIASASAPPSYAQLTAASAVQTGGALHLTVSANGAIPRFPDAYINSVLAFGYGWVDTHKLAGIVLVIHPSFVDSKQDPHGWHTHVIVLTRGTEQSNFCLVSAAVAQGGIHFQEQSGFLTEPAHFSGLSASEINVAGAFIARPDSGCSAATTTGLGIVVFNLIPM